MAREWVRDGLLGVYGVVYEQGLLPMVEWAYPGDERGGAQRAHERALEWMARADGTWAQVLLGVAEWLQPEMQVEVGGVVLERELILGAGWVKTSRGFGSEEEAIAAVEAGEDVVPGWRGMSRLGLVELGSFTRWPRKGNPGVVIFRDGSTKSTQNRVGLTNPGAVTAAMFLELHREQLPEQFGINIAVSPGVEDLNEQEREVRESFGAFLKRGVRPTWFTLNLSCPNTEDDPVGNQGAKAARRLCGAAMETIKAHSREGKEPMPLWVKLSPGLAREQYAALMEVFEEIGVRAVVATNTRAESTPGGAGTTAGVEGERLHGDALAAVRMLMEVKTERDYSVDVIACGGIMNGRTWDDFKRLGVKAGQYVSALVFRGPLAAAMIEREHRRMGESSS